MDVQPLAGLSRAELATVGGKAANLGELIDAGFDVPPGFVVGTEAYRRATEPFRDEILAAVPDAHADPAAFEAAAARIAGLFDALAADLDALDWLAGPVAEQLAALGDPAVAVRSSATAEDLAGASFAGQQDTELNVRGARAVLASIVRCWGSLWTARAMAYRARRPTGGGAALDAAAATGEDPAAVRQAVVVQRLVDAEASGVMFTANPTNGRREQLVIAAAWGLGEAVVGGEVSTDDLVIGPDGRVLTRHTADKHVRTVRTAEGTRTEPCPEPLRRQDVLDDAAAAELAAVGRRIAAHYGQPQDIEWVRAQGAFAIVQSRPITALPDPIGDPPSAWEVPRGAMYFRASIVEQLPDPLTPLFADEIGPAVETSLTAMMGQILPGSPAPTIGFPTVNGYAYYAYRTLDLATMMLSLPLMLPKLLGGGPLPFGPRYWREVARPHYGRLVDAAGRLDMQAETDAGLLGVAEELLLAGCRYYTAVQAVIPVAGGTETVFTSFYDRLIRRPGDPAASSLLLGSDTEPIRAEGSLYDLGRWAAGHPELRDCLDTLTEAELDRLVAGAGPAPVAPEVWAEFVTRLTEHQRRYGHMVYNLDFVHPVPGERAGWALATLRFAMSGEAGDPRERQAAASERAASAARSIAARLDPARRAAFDRLLSATRRSVPLREDALADVGLAWPTIRRALLTLADRLRARGLLDAPDDIFWLTRDELVGCLAGQAAPDRAAVLAERRQRWRGWRSVAPPQLLPERGAVRLWDRFMPSNGAEQSGPVLTGIGASGGSVTAPARVIDSPADFAAMRPGEVLVAAITTPAFTSLFAMAAAVVTDVGGPLSHSSIVAREYGIPAVLGTGVGTRRIRTGDLITVDGAAGTVRLPQ